ncbi:retrovirus-related pol polyprotein from transposon RE2 [Citrus sinensis]|uniref:Retrovirus-related pol polyprotein from transposon RE2 n=1 Tax=Citrus sinensis TaxID=2711 RepID=A0ACB8MV63_CITSI|nr:retrovirus-related pol polyprotein from transposon RE2 [Citrus sinensis]KAH9789534.1 retrovirus-related pol polyprotein from transposon RE2 [Citrus sinensis]
MTVFSFINMHFLTLNSWNNNAQSGNYQGRGGFGVNNANNFGGNFGGFINGKGASDPNGAAVICQICFKPKHTAAECRNRFNKEFVPYYNPYSGYNSYQNPGPRAFYPNSAPRAAFLATSEGDMADQGWYVDSGATHHLINNLQNLNLGREYSACNFSGLSLNKVCTQTSNSQSHLSTVNPAMFANVLHQRFGHPNKHALKNILSSLALPASIPDFCDACQYGKMHQLSFYSTGIKTKTPLELVYTDLWGPASIPSLHGYRYYISFVDDYSRYCWIFPLTLKSEALDTFKYFKTLVEKQLGFSLKSLQSDWGGEYRSFEKFLEAEGIHFRHSCPHTHHQNGVVERKHRHVVETGLTLLAQAKMPLSFWWESFHTASFLINRMPTPVLNNVSPFAKLHGRPPDYKFLRTFGCSCFPLLRPYNNHKLNFHTQKCLMIGYSPIHKGYKCLDSTGKTYIARHVQFNESEFPYFELFPTKSDSQLSSIQPSQVSFSNIPITEVIQDSNNAQSYAIPSNPDAGPDSSHSHTSSAHSSPSHSSQNLSPHIQVHQPVQTSSVQNIHSMTTRSKAGVFKPKTYLTVAQELEPSSVKAALADSKWQQAMHEEFDALQKNQTWVLIPPETAGKIVGNKWVFRIKYNPDGSISKYKARLVAKGFHQTQGVDFFETFSPVVKPCTIRIILSLVVMNHWTIRQLDVNNAFLNGILIEDVFMHQPEGFVHPQFPAHICKLTKALYGLKQAPRAWYDRLKASLIQWGFVTSKSDTSLFVHHVAGEIIVALIYVDDILITGSNSLLVEKVIHQLGAEFALKDLGEFNYFLGLDVTPNVDGLHLSQTKYIGDLLKKAQMVNCKGCSTPMSSTEKLVKDKGEVFENPSLYRSLVGSLQYVTLTRPEIAFTVNKLSQYLSNPSVLHWQACKRVLRYLQYTADHGLQFYSSGSLSLTAFSDADWGSDLDDRKSVGGYCVYLGNNLVLWSSKKQHIVSRSTAESEYRALALTTAEVLWITYLFKELKVSLLRSPVLYCDNKSAEALASNPKYHSKTKHIELDLHFIREHVSRKELQINHVPSCDQVADILTKPLAFDQFHYLRSKLNVLPRP